MRFYNWAPRHERSKVHACLDHKGNAVSPEHLLLAYTNNGYRWRQAKNKASEPAGYALHARIKEGDRGPGPSMENHKAIGLLNNTDPHPLKITKLPSQHSMFGQPFNWHFASGSMVARF